MSDAAKFFFSEKKQAKKTGFQKKRKDPFHSEGLSDNAPSGLGKCRPVGAELKLHGNTGDDSNGEINSEDTRPEPGGAVVVFIPGAQEFGFEVNQEQGETHGQLRENVVKSYGECEMEAMHRQRLFHSSPPSSQGMNPTI